MGFRKSISILGAICAIAMSSAGWASARDFIAPSERFPTIQSAVDFAPSGSTIIVAQGRWEEVVLIQNKDLTLRGQYADINRLSVISNDRFTPYCLEVAGKASVVLDELSIQGCYKGISIRPIGQSRPQLKISRLRSSESVIGLYGSASNLEIRNSGLHRNKGSGAIIFNTKQLLIDTVSFSDNLEYGLVIRDTGPSLVSDRANNRLIRVGASYNGRGGVFLSRLLQDVSIEQMRLEHNLGANLTVRESKTVKIFGSTFNTATFDWINNQADGLRVLSSDLFIQSSHIDENEGRGLAVYGCTNRPSDYSNVMIWDSTASLNSSPNWVSGLAGNCLPVPSLTFILDQGGNSCAEKQSPNTLCTPSFEHIDSFEEAP